MKILLLLAMKEVRDGLRNRWVAMTILILAVLALGLAFLGTAPTGGVQASALSATAVSLTSLTVYLLPLIALLLSYDAIVGEIERGTLPLLLSYPVSRWQVLIGKLLGHTAILAIAIIIGYGGAASVIAGFGGGDLVGGVAFATLAGSSILLGMVFLSLGYLTSILCRERAQAGGLAVALWLLMVVIYDAFRTFNMTFVENARQVSGLTGLGDHAFGSGPVLIGILCTWTALLLAISAKALSQKEV